jgi:hypothetical protein
MAKDDAASFSRSLNPFRGIERSIDSMFDDSFGTGAAGALAQSQPSASAGFGGTTGARSLFLRVVQLHHPPRQG